MNNFVRGDIIKTKYGEVGIVLGATNFGYYTWAKTVTETGLHPLNDTLNGAVLLEHAEIKDYSRISKLLQKHTK